MTEPKKKYSFSKLLKSLILFEVAFWLLFYLVIESFGFLLPVSGSNFGFHFAKPEYFYWLILILPFSYLYLLSVRRKKLIDDNLSQFSKSNVPKRSVLFSLFRYFLLRSAFVFLIIAAAQPIYGRRKVKGTVKSMELVVCLDVSNSMNTRDIDETSRLEIAKRSLNALVSSLSGEKIGLCLFAGNAFVQLPLTTDYDAAKLFIDEVNSNYVSSQGTNVPEALSTAISMFSKEKITKAILVVTDGENHEEEDAAIYEEIQEKNIQVCAMGIGTELGGPVPEDAYNLGNGYRKDAFGQTVVSKLNPNFVKQIAAKTNGYAMITSEPYPDLQTILTQINQMKQMKLRDLEFDVQESRYQIPLIISIVCLILWIFIPDLKMIVKK